jgi:HPr kinase/phosphorylase
MEQLTHGTCIALGGACALLRGPAGIGKSDFALRFIFLARERLPAVPRLVADDQVILQRSGDTLVASCPPALAGMLEVRGLGIATIEAAAETAVLKLIADLDGKAGDSGSIELEYETLLGVRVLRISLDPFEPTAPLKVALILGGSLQLFGE